MREKKTDDRHGAARPAARGRDRHRRRRPRSAPGAGWTRHASSAASCAGPNVKPDAFGIFAEQFARFMGTAQFLIYMTLFVVFWVLWNLPGAERPALRQLPVHLPHPDAQSLQASYAAPLILLAQNRQEVRDRVVNEQDRQANARAHADMEFLAREVAALRMAVGEVATRDFLRSELRNLLEELDERHDRGRPRQRGRPTTDTERCAAHVAWQP